MLSPARNWLPSIASFLSCDSHTPQIRPGRLMTASQLLLVQTIQVWKRTPSKDELSPAPEPTSHSLLDVVKGKILDTFLWLDYGNVAHFYHSRLWLNCLPMHSSVGLSLHINTAGSFRKSHSAVKTEQWLTWTITNLYLNIHIRVQDSREGERIEKKG